jgi:hypothetical protein
MKRQIVIGLPLRHLSQIGASQDHSLTVVALIGAARVKQAEDLHIYWNHESLRFDDWVR